MLPLHPAPDEYVKSKQGGGDDPDVRYDANSGWKREESIKEHKGKHTMSQDFEATDTPDFFDDSDLSKKAQAIAYTDGMMGSSGKGRQSGTHNPGVEGALEVNPDIYVPEEEVIEIENSDFVLPKSGMTDLDFEMFTIGGDAKELYIDVRPVCMTFEPFYCGFTADSHPAFSVSPDSGKMERRNGDPTTVCVTCDPGPNLKGEITGYLCFILPEEKARPPPEPVRRRPHHAAQRAPTHAARAAGLLHLLQDHVQGPVEVPGSGLGIMESDFRKKVWARRLGCPRPGSEMLVALPR